MSSPPSSSAVSPPPENPPPPLPLPSLPPPPPAVRKFPAPCWTQDETLALIHVYQDKWFSLRRRNLRTADWEAVAEEVNRRCPNQSPPKTSAQCRHKMEKLRKRYRTEKQRITNLPVPINHHHPHPQFLGMGNNFFPSSSWVFFDLMDAMEIGSAPASVSGSTPLLATASASGNVHVPSKQSNFMNHSIQNGGFVKEEKPPRGKEDLGKYFDEVLMSVGKGRIGGGGGAPIKFKVKNSNNNDRFFDDSKYDYDYDYDASGIGSGRNFASGSGSGFNNNNNGGNKRKIGGGGGGFITGHSSKRGPAAAAAARGRRGEGAVGEMVASINMLGDGLLKMEKMKMEMMQDLQRQRMEMEINNSKMILESQHSIVNAFLQGFNKLNKPNKLMHLD